MCCRSLKAAGEAQRQQWAVEDHDPQAAPTYGKKVWASLQAGDDALAQPDSGPADPRKGSVTLARWGGWTARGWEEDSAHESDGVLSWNELPPFEELAPVIRKLIQLAEPERIGRNANPDGSDGRSGGGFTPSSATSSASSRSISKAWPCVTSCG